MSRKIFLNNHKLEISKSFKYLGLYFDSKLLWNTHAKYVKTKASQLLVNLLPFAKRNFGINSKSLETIYKGAVLPIISYGCSVWIEAIDKQYICKPFTSMQRQIALRITKAYKTVSTDALNVIANLIPIELHLKQTAMNYFIKKGLDNTFTDDYLRSININLQMVQKSFPSEKLQHFSLRKPIQVANEINTEVNAYTDGSKSGSGVGSAFCVMNDSQVIRQAKYKLSSYCSVFQAELFAILNALKYINGKFISGDCITVCTDSQSCLQALKDPNSVTYLVQEIFTELRAAEANNICLQFAWIRAHNGNTGNDLADSLAKAAATSHQSISYDMIPVSFVKKIV